jgi:hypothetical protein
MDELEVLEKLVSGTVAGMLLACFAGWHLWRRLNAREAQLDGLTREVLQGLGASTAAMMRMAEAVEQLSRAIEDNKHHQPRQRRD